jgi:hypothetical protein
MRVRLRHDDLVWLKCVVLLVAWIGRNGHFTTKLTEGAATLETSAAAAVGSRSNKGCTIAGSMS